MVIRQQQELLQARCLPCEGGVERFTLAQAEEQLQSVPGWRLTHDGQRIRKDWTVRKFTDAIKFFQLVADLAEKEAHHPDLHVESYRKVWIEIWTHAIGGLSENDFILAAKINELPVEVKPT